MQSRPTRSPTIPVAVIMAVYGKDDTRLFARALDSMIAQDYERGPVRIYLCVDGPAPDALEDVIDRYKSRLHKVTRNDGNIGLARSLNRLIDALEDETFVFRMDADDYSRPHRIRVQVAHMDAHPEIDILGGAITEVDSAGQQLKTLSYPQSMDAVRRQLPRRTPLAHPSVCFRRSAITKFGHYPVEPVNQDIALWFECLRMGLTISNVDDVLVDMTAADDFLRGRGWRRSVTEFRIWTRGIWRTEGLTWRYIYPLMRFVFRLMPRPVAAFAYRSRLR